MALRLMSNHCVRVVRDVWLLPSLKEVTRGFMGTVSLELGMYKQCCCTGFKTIFTNKIFILKQYKRKRSPSGFITHIGNVKSNRKYHRWSGETSHATRPSRSYY